MPRSLTACFLITLLAACGSDVDDTVRQPAPDIAAPATAQSGDDYGLVWAINVGGPAYTGIDGTVYDAESGVSGGELGTMVNVKGSQDPTLYRTYREGDIRVRKAIANGNYDVTFHFAEPAEVSGGERIFDVIVQGQRRVTDLDVMLARDGKVFSALTVTVPDVAIDNGMLEIGFNGKAMQPVLSALVVRNKHKKSEDWQLVWSDEFDYEGPPDPLKWSANVWPARKVNDEDQAYTERAKNLRVENGHLVIEAHKEQYDNAEYTSGRIHSDRKGDFLYGRFEVSAKVPRGQGTWAAAWMLPSDPFHYATTCEEGADWQGSSTCDAWPNSGEIDILEHVGYEMGHVHGTVHNEAYYWVKWEQRKGRILLDEVADTFYTYTLEWSPERIDIFVDDTLYFTYMNEGEGWESWPYDKPFHVILNLAIGGAWGRAGGPIDDSIFPKRMLVDYVRVYQKGDKD